MFKWFVETAPVRLKLLISFGIQFGLVAVCGAAVALLRQGEAVAVCGGALAVSMLAGYFCRKRIADPYVTTVERMEALAAGDVKAPVRFTHYTDCVGRMTVAMDIFRKNLLAREAAEAETTAIQAGAERQRQQAAAQASAELKEHLIDLLAHGLEQLAAGDLRFRITRPFQPDYEKLRQDFNNAMATLQGTIVNVSANMRAVRDGAGEMTSATDDLSRRTEQQAASLEQTSAALEQITATVRQSAAGAKEARDLVERAKSNAERSGEVIRETIGAMGNIENSARQISSIIVLIDEIAFQTNLLALNAGVEAARAGDAGRGFAVVATEVRALAQRSAEAAKEIKTLIQTSGAQVENGVKLVGQTGEMLGHIVTEVARLNEVIVSIASSAQEQATGMSEVNTAVGQMDRMTQQNAAMVEQSTAASHSLANEAEELARLLDRFKTGEAPAEPAAAPRPPAKGAARRAAPARPAPKPDAGTPAPARAAPAMASAAAGWDEF
jgi:methyl-accepting chemotaxis protein